jgi:polyphenol oxidase
MDSKSHNDIILYTFENLAFQKRLLHFVTARMGGCSVLPYDTLNMGLHVGDDPSKVIENRQRVFSAVGTELGRLVTCKQIHAGTVTLVTREMAGNGAFDHSTAVDRTDALITR